MVRRIIPTWQIKFTENYPLFRLLPKLISLIVAKKFKITIRFGRIGLPFTLLNVEICKNGYSVVGGTDNLYLRIYFKENLMSLMLAAH